MYMQRTTSGAAGNGLYTTIKYLRCTTSGAAGNGLGTTIKYLRAAAGIGSGTTIKLSAHNKRHCEQWLEHHDHPRPVV